MKTLRCGIRFSLVESWNKMCMSFYSDKLWGKNVLTKVKLMKTCQTNPF
ncbi:hypothetical protein VCHA52P453_50169 [Vibrio chagasii]|nr:hypothetical protein VCHA39P226_50051 [Vibrio chagasii]CAH7371043.1 hypothetical protein VCHA52P453_50169 [Vibrio chagasii]CAH7393361.1 hypothetical protein VCHA52P456_70048 [Vibrio chagasii]